MKIVNPNRTRLVTQADKDAFTAILVTLNDRDPTFAEIRAALPAGQRARATDGLLHQVALELGLTVAPTPE